MADDGVTNEDLYAELRDWRRELNGRVGTLEAWRMGVDTQLERQGTEIVRKASATLQAMVADAMKSGMEELFIELMTRQRQREREERREDFREFFGSLHKSTVWVMPVLQVALLILGLYAFFWR